MTMRGYFAVRLTELREQGLFEPYVDLYDSIAERLQTIDGFSLHAPHRVSNPGSHKPDGLSPQDVYLLDRIQVSHSHVIIACLELPSFGVGAELQIATELGIPVVAFYYEQATRGPSRLVLGMPTVGAVGAEHQKLIRYAPTPQGRQGLLDALAAAVLTALTTHTHRTPHSTGIALALDRRRRELEMSHNELARASGTAIGTIKMLSLAGAGLMEWAQDSNVRGALTIPREEINEDLVLLPSLPTTLRIARALGSTPAALFLPT